jgi:hypothetical protein
MSQSPLTAYLLDDGPPVSPEELALFLEADVPEALAVATLNKVALLRTQPEAAAQDPARWVARGIWARGVWAGGALGLAMAAALLFAVLPNSASTPQGDPSHMMAKGEQVGPPTVSLKIAAIQNGLATRHRTDRAYQPGDALAFRVQADKSGFASLVHVENNHIEVLLEAPLVPGESDLGLPNGQHARWSFDDSDTDSLFAIISSTEPMEADVLQAGLAEFLGENPITQSNFCLAAQSLGCQCDAIEVMVLQ